MHVVPQSLLGLAVNPADVPAAGGVLDDACWARALTGFLSFIPHTARLNVRVEEVAAPAIRMQLPWQPALIGDPHRRLVHGGVLTMFADTLCGSAVLTGLSAPEVCPTLDLRLDHYRPGVEGLALVGEARVLRVTESMVFTEAQIWQQPGKILCRAIGNFVRLGERNTPSGFAEALLAAMGAPARMQILRGAESWWHPGRHGKLCLGPKKVLGVFGELHPKVLKALDVKGPAVAFTLYPEDIPLPRSSGGARAPLVLNGLQPVERDFAFVVDAQVAALDLVNAAAGADKALIEDVRVFDEFVGGSLGEGKKPLAISVRLQPAGATLTEKDIEAVAAKIVEKVAKATGGTLRG